MNSVGLALFHALCEVGNGLEYVRDAHAPASETWLALTCLLGEVDACIDALVHSTGLGGADDHA